MNISTAVKINPNIPPHIACDIVCFFNATLAHIMRGYNKPNIAPIGPKRIIRAQTGPDNPVVWMLIFHFLVISITINVFIV